MSQHHQHAHREELASPRPRKPWTVAIDELPDPTSWLLEIDSPNIYLTFQIANIAVLDQAVDLLNASLNLRISGSEPVFYGKADDVALGHFGKTAVHLLRDNEDFSRCFLVVGQASRSTLRISIDGAEEIRAFAQALEHALEGLSRSGKE